MKLLLFVILAVICWPAALAVVVLYPVLWLLALPFRVVGVVVGGALALVGAILFAPVRLLRAI